MDAQACEADARAELDEEMRHLDQLLERPAAALVAPFMPPARDDMLMQELEAIDQLGSAAQPAPLRRAVRALRDLESSITFQAQLLATQRTVARATGYSNPNFAYGSTSAQLAAPIHQRSGSIRPCVGGGTANRQLAILRPRVIARLVVHVWCVRLRLADTGY